MEEITVFVRMSVVFQMVTALHVRMSVVFQTAIILRVQTATVFQMAMDYLIIVMCVITILQMTVLKTA